jgi:hypothetical protein
MGAGTEIELTVPSAIAFESRSQVSHWLAWLNREEFEQSATYARRNRCHRQK